MAPGRPRVMQRSNALKSSQEAKRRPAIALPELIRVRCSCRSTGVAGGSLPSAGSTISDVRLDKSPCSSQ